MSEKTLSEALDDMALNIISEAMKPDTVLSSRLDAFKTVSNYYLGLNKSQPDGAKGSNFGAFKQRIADASNGAQPGGHA